jgi:hypothetical protein
MEWHGSGLLLGDIMTIMYVIHKVLARFTEVGSISEMEIGTIRCEIDVTPEDEF